MFIVQVMYAEGLVKILNWILVVRNYERREQYRKQLHREIEILEMAAAMLNGLPRTSSLDVVEKQLAERWRIMKEEHRQYVSSLSELRRIGVAREDYETKFKLISSDCLRIGHGSVKPPQWEAAAA